MSSPAPTPISNGSASVEMFLLALRVLSAKTASGLLPLVGLVMGFILWLKVLPEPTIFQLVGLGLYGVFFVTLLMVRK